MEIKKTLTIKAKEIDYFIQYKKIKNVYLRVDNGKIKISAPHHCPISVIENLIKDRYDYIKEQIDRYRPLADYRDGGYVLFLGKRYRIELRDMQIRKVVIKEDRFIVYHNHIEKVLEDYLKDYLLRYIQVKIEYYCQKESRFPTPIIELKRTKRRYGACFYRRNKVSFNPILVHKDKSFIDYVIVHELCHFIQPNHSPAFYKEVEHWIPNYKTIMKEGGKDEDYFSEQS